MRYAPIMHDMLGIGGFEKPIFFFLRSINSTYAKVASINVDKYYPFIIPNDTTRRGEGG